MECYLKEIHYKRVLLYTQFCPSSPQLAGRNRPVSAIERQHEMAAMGRVMPDSAYHTEFQQQRIDAWKQATRPTSSQPKGTRTAFLRLSYATVSSAQFCSNWCLFTQESPQLKCCSERKCSAYGCSSQQKVYPLAWMFFFFSFSLSHWYNLPGHCNEWEFTERKWFWTVG